MKGIKSMRKCLLAGIACLLLAAVLVGCGADDAESTDPTEAGTIVEATDPSAQATLPLNCVVVNTPYGDLQYQDQWMEFMRTEQLRDGENLVVSFYSDINGTRYALFDIIVGTSDGNAVGQLTGTDGVKRSVYVQMKQIMESEALADNERNRLYAMQEEINYVLENLK